MSGLQHRNGSYRVIFRYHGKQHAFTLGEVTQTEAEAKVAQVDYLLMRLKQRLAAVPSGVSIVDYLQFDGREEVLRQETEKIDLKQLRDKYLKVHEKSLEVTTIKGIKQHFGHLMRKFGEQFPIAELKTADLQGYVDHRCLAKGRHGRTLSAATVKKELVSLRTAWNWGQTFKYVSGKFPSKGLAFPKLSEKPPFMTRAEIERRLKTSKLSNAERSELWEALYLTVDETAEFLAYARTTQAQPFVYPMLAFAGHTGSRRSEMIRAKIADVDLDGREVTIHERKRVRGVLTTRRVPMSEFLYGVLKEWLAHHPGGDFLFCQTPRVVRSKTRKGVLSQLTNDEAADHFTRTFADSTWSMVKGWHCLRHSFISAMASKAVDQRLIDDFVGHCSEEQRRRYRHLYPSVKQNAISQVFG